MAALNPEIIKDTKGLISLYQKNPRFKTAFDKIVANNINATYHGRPVKLYVEVLKNVTSKYKQEYTHVRKIVLHDMEGRVGELFSKVNPKSDFERLDEAYNAALRGKNIISEKNIKQEEIEEINKTEEKFKKNDKGFIDNKAKREEYQKKIEAGLLLKEDGIVPESSPKNEEYNPASPEEIARLKTALLPKEEVPKNVLVSPSGQALTKPFIEPEEPSMETLVGPGGEPIKYQPPPEIRQESSGYSQPSTSLPNIPISRLKNFASNSKTFFKGGAKASGVVVKGAGRVAGTAIKAGAGAAAKLGASAALGAATGGISLILTLATSPGMIKDLFKYILYIVAGIFALLFFMSIFNNGMNSSALLPPYDVPTMDSVNGDIASCKFYRASEPASYKSNLLLSYISEASSLTGIPPVVLAAFIRVESPSSVNMSDDQIKNYAASCAVSSTGALGIMQIQPPGTTSAAGDPASCVDCIDAGAKLLGKTVQDMTKSDYCDPRTSIIVGSGWILKKMGYLGYKNIGKWDPAWTNDQGAINSLVFTYYGCLKYGGEKDCTGPYDYGNDVWTSIQNCKPISPPPSGQGSFNSYFCQSNPSWASLPISNSGDTMSSGGCGLSSLAMILNYFGLPYTPTEILTKFNQNPSWYTYAGGTNIYSTLEWVKSLGFEVVDLSPDVSDLSRDIPRYLNNGYLILGSQYINSPLSHIFVVSKILPNGNVILQDPDKTCQPNLEKTITGVMNDYSNPTYGKWMYAKAIKKVR